jgi:autotransporter translocation and assembly factor TamB
VAIVLVSLLASMRLAMVSDWLRGYAVSVVQKSVLELTGARLSIQDHQGDLYRGVSLIQVSVISADTLLSAQAMHLEYSLWPLFSKSVAIGRLQIDGLRVHIVQDSSGTFNFEQLIPKTEEPSVSESNWNVLLPNIYLNDGSLSYSSFDGSFLDTLHIRGITASGSFRTTGPKWIANLRSMQFEANHAMLNDALGVSLVASAEQEIINIESFLIRYGKSLANVSGTYSSVQDSLNAELQMKPLASDDVNSFTDSVMVQNLNANLTIGGSLGKFETSLQLLDGSLELLRVDAHVGMRDQGYGLTYLSALSPGCIMADYIQLPNMGNLQFQRTQVIFAGWVPFAEIEAAEGDAKVETTNAMFENYRAGEIEADISKRSGKVTIGLNLQTGSNRLEGTFEALDIFSQSSSWNTTLIANISSLRQLDSSQTLPISFTSKLQAIGTGLSKDILKSRFNGMFTNVSIDGQLIDRVDIAGSIQEKLRIDSLIVAIGEGRLEASGSSTLDMEFPVYEFEVTGRRIDVSNFKGYEKLQTDINATISISGIGYDEVNRNISIEFKAQNSWLNQTQIDEVHASVVLARNRLFVEEANLTSEIADGRFRGDFDIEDVFRPSNNMVFNLSLKNVQPLAQFVGVDVLSAKGEIRGRVEEGATSPELIAIVALDDIAYNSITVMRVVGQYVMPIQNTPTFQAELDLISPNMNGVQLDDIRFATRGKITGKDISGYIGLDVDVYGESGIGMAGSYTFIADTLRLSTSSFDIRGPARTFRQTSTFNLIYSGGVAQTDTLTLRAEPDAQLMVYVPYVSADSTSAWLDARNVNLEALQTGLMLDPLLAGYMTGNVSVAYAKDNLALNTEVDLWDLYWENLKIDSAIVRASIDQETLLGSVRAINNNHVLIDASVDLPFKIGDPNEFDAFFFDQPVHATMMVDSLNLADYEVIFKHFRFPQLRGTIKASTTLSGIAGKPVLTGGVTLIDGSLAGIPVDQLELDWIYNQSQTQLSCSAILMATGQEVFNSSFNLPLNLDLRNFSQILPESSDPINGSLVAEGFNLALLSPFLPIEYADQLSGAASGRIEMGGTIGNPRLEGNLALRNGGLRIVPGNVALRNIFTNIVLDRDRIRIDSLAIQSGSGFLSGKGQVGLDGFELGRLSADIRARQFLVSDTRDVRMVVSFESNLGGTMLRPELTGSMIVNQGTVYLDNFGERTVEEVQLDGESQLQPPSIYDSLSVRMRVQVDPNVWIRNRTSPEMALELEGDVDLLKDRASDLMAFGSLGTRQGYAMQYGKRFQLERGQLAFSGDLLNPKLDIVSLYTLKMPEDIEIRYLIGGTLDEPIFDFSSNPEMELENIISYTLFGKPFGALFSWQQSFSGGGGGSALARDAAIGVLVDRVESLATESLGLDLLQIDSNRLGETVTTSVKAGKYITDKLFVAVLNELGGSDAVTRVVLEYYIRRNLLLMVTQGNDRRSGVDLLWKYEY